MPHTPGPWEVHHWGDNEGDIRSSDGKLVCVMRDGATAQEEDWEGDARLIAAAPDLLDALRDTCSELEWLCECHRKCKEEPSDEAYSAVAKACTVLAKAEGRE